MKKKEKRDKYVAVMMTETELQKLNKQSERAGMTTSAYIRHMSLYKEDKQ
jgi:hypothetical protein